MVPELCEAGLERSDSFHMHAASQSLEEVPQEETYEEQQEGKGGQV